jgi:RecB family exonuclease
MSTRRPGKAKPPPGFYAITRQTDPGPAQTFALIQLRNLTQLIFVQTEIPDVEVLGDARWRDRFRDDHQAVVQMPANDDLRRGFAVFIRQLTDNF